MEAREKTKKQTEAGEKKKQRRVNEETKENLIQEMQVMHNPQSEGEVNLLEISPSVHPDDIFKIIDAIANSEPLPKYSKNPVDLWFDPITRKRVAGIVRIEVSRVNAKIVYIDHLTKLIGAYVTIHEDSLGERKIAFVLATFASLTSSLRKSVVDTWISFSEVYSDGFSRIRKIPHLTNIQKAEQIQSLYTDTRRAQGQLNETFDELLNTFREAVNDIIKEVEQKKAAFPFQRK